MPRNEDGEFELILGNKQLLSVFFIVVTLLAVFFAMGFIMGRSVNPVAEARKVDNGPSDKPIVVDAKPSASGLTASARPVEIKSPIETEVKTPEVKAPEVKAPEKKLPEPDPKAEQKAKALEAEAKKAEAKKAEREKAEREKEAKAEAKKAEREKKAEPKPAPAATGKPGAGTYLQVAAVGKSEADLVSEVLGKKGFRTAIIGVDNKPDLYRVLVGPVKAGADQSKTMDELKAAGFKPFPRKL